MPDTTVLDDNAVAEIEAAITSGDSQLMYETASVDNVRALCATVRALRAENGVYRRAFETDAALSEPKVGDLNALQVVKKLKQLATQLAAVTQERDALREQVEKMNAIISAYENQDEEALEEAEQL
jgi:hypothetical protein